jgi:hypothetical protein
MLLLHCSREGVMPEAVPPDEFTPCWPVPAWTSMPPRRRILRHAHAKLQAMLELLRAPAPELAAEPAFTFAAEELP